MDNTQEDFAKEPISITKEALLKALELQDQTPAWYGLDLRVYLEGKGCDGFFYGVCFDKREEEDIVFENEIENQELSIIADPKTLEFTEGSSISWGSHDGKEGFLVENPKHRKYRGKFYKRGYWQKRLKEK